ncbi:MAG TPA: delta-60 repeat domain-containing protein, partial [Patescibacteria group bacterium]|nr:delta-60 repeat domain-containing protein [Patescibacteria group bacterium]
SFAPLLLEPWGPGVNALALQPDSKIILAGGFESVDAQPRTNLARLNPDGSLDAIFNPSAFTNFANGAALEALALLPDRKILVGGVFNSVAGQNRTNLARLNPDGTLDQSFTCNLSRNSAWSYGGVSSLLVQPDGKVLVGGLFEVSGNTNIVRLNPDGSLDASFTPGRYHALPDSNIQVNPVQTIALQSDGKILLGGAFTIGGSYDQDFSYLVRLEPNGEPDTNFNTTVDLNQLLPEQGGYINSLLVQPDGKIVVGGVFSWLAGDFRNNLARLNADGTLDTAFNPGADLWGVTSIALQGDGKLILAGTFDSVGGQSRTNLARLNPDGTVDPAFNPASDSAYPYAGVALQTDGKILVCGSFRTVAGQDRTAVGRLTNPGEPTQELSYDGSVITWSIGGTSPQFWATTFEYSIDGSSWTTLGTGVHTANGWQFSDVSLPGNSIIRARGYINGGPYNASSWFLEAVRSPALAITDFKFLPQGQTQFTALGPPGQSAVIDTSSDLKTWSARSTNTLVNGFFTFSESQPLGSSNRFYRLHQ